MDFNLTEEQQLLRDSVERFVREKYDIETRRSIVKSPEGISEACWQNYAELGWLALVIPEEFGGLGLEFTDVAILMEGLGAGLVLEPVISSTVLAARIIEQSGNNDQQEQLLPQIAAGEARIALAHSERGSRYAPDRVEDVTAERTASGYVLSGTKFMALDAPSAAHLIVSAKLAGADDFALFLVEAGMPGVEMDSYRLIDGSGAADVTLSRVALSDDALLVGAGRAGDVLEEALDRCLLAQVATAIGAMDATMKITAEYIKTRKQFGQAIGKFQALQHRMAEMLTLTEDARSMLFRGLANLEADTRSRKAAISAAKVVTAEAGKFVGAQGIQLHGGMGMTDECNVGHYFKYLTVFEKSYGDPDFHMNRYIEVSK